MMYSFGQSEWKGMRKKLVSGTALAFLLIGFLALAFNIRPAKASGAVYIRADGSIDPPTANITTSDYVAYTFTGNINDSVVVQRSNIVIDGKGHLVQGSGAYGSHGISFSGLSNVTVKNTNVRGFECGIEFVLSSHILMAGNNITENNADGIRLGFSSNNSIIENTITNNGYGVWPGNGIHLYSSSNCNRIVGNSITANKVDGIRLGSSSSNTIVGNNIANNGNGVRLYSSPNNDITRNSITANENCGIFLSESSNNNGYHNDFADNNLQVYSYAGSINAWDNGAEGNYWSNYTGVDVNPHDGIGDSPHIIDVNNQDNYPLMNPYITGDYNHDGTVNMTDVDLVRVAWQSRIGDLNFNPHVDFNMDGVTNIKDAAIIGLNWQKHT